MVRVLAVADEVAETMWNVGVRRLRPDVVLAAGDLPFDYLDYLASTLDVPVVFVPGNHDPDLGGVRLSRVGVVMRAGLPVVSPGPPGGTNVDGRCLDVAGLRIAGLGGSLRYRPGPNQYSEREQARRARRLVRDTRRRSRDGRGVDVLLTHSPPLGLGDGEDLPHRGFGVLHDVMRDLTPRYLLHGHIHPYGRHIPAVRVGATTVRNIVGHHLIEL